MYGSIPIPSGGATRVAPPWSMAWLWACLALLSSLVLPARAADFTDGVAVSGNTATIWFKSSVNTTWVDVHYTLDGGGQLNVRMAYSSALARHEHPVTVAAGHVLAYWFTYNNGTPAYDTPTKRYTVGGGTTAPQPTGLVCFHEHADYAGASFCADAASVSMAAPWDNKVSSVKLQSGYQLELFDGANHSGRSLTLSADTANLASLSFNDIASSFKLGKAGNPLPTSDNPDFGPNVSVFDSSTPVATIQARLDNAFNSQLLSPSAQFGPQRYAFLFKPGRYDGVHANLGFYTSIVGLGQNPDDVTLQGSINVDSGWNYGDASNATQNFWRSAENVALIPTGGTNRWAVSQAAPMRRIHIIGNLHLGPSNQDHGQGYSSGGYLADSKVDGSISSGSQQQWYTRDSHIGVWYDGVWNMTFSGVAGAPANAFPNPPHTTLATTPVSREKPFLYVDSTGKYRVFVPALRTQSSGASWVNGTTPGASIPMSRFYVARPSDSTATLNAALAQGLNLFFTPGTYQLSETLRITRADTVVMGIGFPTLVPLNGVDAMSIADVDGVKISGLLFDAGTVNSQALLTVGPAGSSASHAANPTSIQDVYFRIGGAVAGKATNSLVVNSHHTIIDHIWAWRADHGSSPTGWDINPADTGVIVNGNHVLATGLFVEHYQKYQVIWNGQNGKTIFFQSEMPYDPPTQAAWRSGALGYAAYKVADSVTTHEAWSLGSYCYFNLNPSIHADRGFEVPVVPGVRLHSVFTVSLGGVGVIDHVVNNTGGAAQGVSTIPVNVVHFP